VFITTSDDRSVDTIELFPRERNRQLIEQAVSVAKTADTIILAIGDTEQTSREGFAANHLGDRDNLDIVGDQNALVDALAALGKPLVVCAVNGRPPSWPNVAARADALLECWYSGQEGGTAIAEALLGTVNPGAKLPVSVARDAGQLPIFYNAKPSARRGYLFGTTAPLFPFGHGLSYTSFDISAPRLSATRVAADHPVQVEAPVTNTGPRAGDEVVQLYITRTELPVTRPVLELKGFERVTLAPGESKTVRFTLTPAQLAYWDRTMTEVNGPGPVAVHVGNSSANLKSAEFTVA
jgi:beta-glucosidase